MTRISRRNLWLPAVAVALIAILAWWGTNSSISYHSALRCCVFDPGTGGGLGLVLWARQMGIPVCALQDPLWESLGSAQSREGNCFLTAGDGSWSPWQEELTKEQWASIRRWVDRGNSLIVMTSNPATLPKVFLDDVFGSGLRASTSTTARATSKSADEDELPLFNSVAETPETSTVALPEQQSLTVNADGHRWPLKPDRGESAADWRGTVWLRETVGKGAIYVLVDDFAWTNSGFDRSGNADALAALLKRELRGGVFGFDEYRHGHGRVESFSAFLLRLPGASTFCLIAALLAGMYLLGRNIRFGSPEAYVLEERRSAKEYVEAAAFLNQRARAAPLAVESVVRRIRAIVLRRGHASPELNELLAQGERFIASEARPAKPSEVCSLVRRMIALRKQLYGS
jgi:hypothetical protein